MIGTIHSWDRACASDRSGVSLSSPYYTHSTNNVNGNCAQYQMTPGEPVLLRRASGSREAGLPKRGKSCRIGIFRPKKDELCILCCCFGAGRSGDRSRRVRFPVERAKRRAPARYFVPAGEGRKTDPPGMLRIPSFFRQRAYQLSIFSCTAPWRRRKSYRASGSSRHSFCSHMRTTAVMPTRKKMP